MTKVLIFAGGVGASLLVLLGWRMLDLVSESVVVPSTRIHALAAVPCSLPPVERERFIGLVKSMAALPEMKLSSARILPTESTDCSFSFEFDSGLLGEGRLRIIGGTVDAAVFYSVFDTRLSSHDWPTFIVTFRELSGAILLSDSASGISAVAESGSPSTMRVLSAPRSGRL